jgi:hypothetical protein
MAKIKTKEAEENNEEMDLEKEWDKLDEQFKNKKGELITPSADEITMVQGDADDGFDASDIAFPKLQIAQGVGPLSDLYPKGSIVLDKEMEIGKMDGTPVEITVLNIQKTFEENVPFGGDELPRIAKSKEEVLRLGGTTDWSTEDGQKIPPSFKPCADALICIKQPEGLDDEWFPYEFEGTNYTFCTWKIKGMAYSASAVPINTAKRMYYRKGLETGSFMLSTEKRLINGNTVACPKVQRGKKHHEEFVQWLKEFVG